MAGALKYSLILVVLSLGMGALGCSDAGTEDTTTETNSVAEATLALLPASTRGALWVDVDGLLSGAAPKELRALLSGAGVEPALSEPFGRLGQHLEGIDPARIDAAMLVFTTQPADGLLVIAELQSADALDLSGLESDGLYRNGALYVDAATGHSLAVLAENLVVIGAAELVRAALDVQAGVAKRASDAAAIGPYLGALNGAGSVRFVVGLPALYRTYEASDDDVSLRGARVVSGAIELTDSGLTGDIAIHADNAERFVMAYGQAVGDAERLTMLEPLQTGLPPRIAMSLAHTFVASDSAAGLASRGTLKRLFHGMNAVDYAKGVGTRGNAPWMNFAVGTEPNSIFINFRFKDEAQRKAFAAEHLPAGFELMPIQILADEEPDYFLVLNVYRSGGGLVSGARAEWSVFVRDPDTEKPRFMVIQAAAEAISADPVNLLTMPEPVRHELSESAIATYVGVAEEELERSYFESEITWPLRDPTVIHTARQFVSANDRIFWGNGVADRGLYNGTVFNRDALLVPPGQLVVRDQSRWAPYVASEPAHAFVYTVGLDIVVSPWWNLDADHLDVTAEHLTELEKFKNGFYPGLISTQAEKGMRGEAAILTTFEVDNTTPSAFVHFAVLDPQALEARLDLPSGHKLAPLRLFEEDAEAAHYLTLHVYQLPDAVGGVRAEWYAYTDDGTSHPHRMVIGAESSEMRVDPVKLLALPSSVEHALSGTTLSARVASERLRVALALEVGAYTNDLPSRDWVEAMDRTCFANGVCDKLYYDGATLTDPLARVAVESISITELVTPWDGLIADVPTSAFVRQAAQRFGENPWHNVP